MGKNYLVETVAFVKDTSPQLGNGVRKGWRLKRIATAKRTAFYFGNGVRDLNRMQVVMTPENQLSNEGYPFCYNKVLRYLLLY